VPLPCCTASATCSSSQAESTSLAAHADKVMQDKSWSCGSRALEPLHTARLSAHYCQVWCRHSRQVPCLRVIRWPDHHVTTGPKTTCRPPQWSGEAGATPRDCSTAVGIVQQHYNPEREVVLRSEFLPERQFRVTAFDCCNGAKPPSMHRASMQDLPVAWWRLCEPHYRADGICDLVPDIEPIPDLQAHHLTCSTHC